MLRSTTLVLLLATVPQIATAAGLTGTIVATPGYGAPERPAQTTEDVAYYWEVPNGIVPTVPFRLRVDDQVIVTLEGVGLEGDPAREIDVQIGGPSMVPQTVVAAPGSRVRFINHSGLTVELYAPAVPGFVPEALHTAHMRVVPVTTPGAFEVRSGHHPNFRGWVVVAPGKRATRVGRDGAFSFADVPPGTYTLQVHLRGAAVLTRSVRIEADDVALGELRLGEAQAAPAAAPAAAATQTANEAAEEARGGRRGGRRGRGGGGGGGNAAGAAAAPAQGEPRLAPGELRPHRLSGGP